MARFVTFRRYWPWFLALIWLLAYEGWAIARHDWPATLSHMVWRGQMAWPALVWVTTGVVVVLWLHFFVRRRS